MHTRIGPQMKFFQCAVARDPGHSKLYYVESYTTRRGHSSQCFGYAALNRAIDAGLVWIDTDPKHRGRYRCWPHPGYCRPEDPKPYQQEFLSRTLYSTEGDN